MCITHNPRKIDECMWRFIENLKLFKKEGMIILACCCGHKRYPMTIVIKTIYVYSPSHDIYDLVSGKAIPRQKKFYKKDKKGYYYIPEVSKEIK